MEKMNDLRDLLKHEIMDLYSVEDQIIEALPKMIEKAGNGNLKKLLQDHLKVTRKHKDRLDKIKKIMGEKEENQEESKGLFSRLFGGSSSEQKCKGMEGILKEGDRIMGEDMNPEVRDAAIIAAAQKVEHYEICGYGTARAYARELMLNEVAQLLEETLNEEYEADDNLTVLAVGRLNVEAEFAGGDMGEDEPLKPRGNTNAGNRKSSSSEMTRGKNSNSQSGRGSKSGGSKSSSSSSKAEGSKRAAAAPKTSKKVDTKLVKRDGKRGSSSASSKGAAKKSASRNSKSAAPSRASKSAAPSKSAARSGSKTSGNKSSGSKAKNSGRTRK